MPKIVVIGESCLDEFVYCEALRLAPDVPIPVLEEISRSSNPGMAANVHRNISSKESDVTLITNHDWQSVVKTRYVDKVSNHHFFRVDSFPEIKPIELEQYKFNSDIVVISDYNKGFLHSEVIKRICEDNELVFLDTKKKLGDWAKSASFIKINDFEYLKSQREIDENLAEKIIRTRGQYGCDFRGKNYPVESIDVRDTAGAGDSFLAALVVEYLVSQDIFKSIMAANKAASKVVTSRGVGVI